MVCEKAGSCLKRCLVVFFVAAMVLITIILWYKHTPPSYACFYKAAVAADNGKCSEIGKDILKLKGSAVDAAIAALLCLGVVHPHNLGLGGGVIFNIYDASTGNVETIDARESAPMSAYETMFGTDAQMAQKGVFSIAVPGQIRGYEVAHKRYGRLPWKELFKPSINLARDGFKINKALADGIEHKRSAILNDETLCEVFCDTSRKETLKENDILRLPKLAQTYQTIADYGPDVFYSGSLANDIVKDISDRGGNITLQDLKEYKAKMNKTLNITVGDNNVYVPTSPSSGPVLALILNILKGYNFSPRSVSTQEKRTLTYHRIIEAFRFAYAQRTKLGDPLYVNINDVIQNMTSEHFANNIRNKITNTTHPGSYYEPEYYVPDVNGTSHLSIIAEDGSAVAVTSSINDHFGSLVMSPSTGIIFNNQMDDFCSPGFNNSNGVPPSPNNFIQPGKQPLSSMSPTIIFDKHNKVKMVVGASGGPKITTGTAQVIMNVLFFNYDLNKAVKEPRLHNQLMPNRTSVESDFEESVYQDLHRTYLHEIKVILPSDTIAKVQAIVQQQGEICAKCDDRKRGYPAGY
ncbi:glutathione hydrolase 1 proenzyme-like [Xyrauchen texanus]|uniref:glutathione hydrolase 1 proenzyme-like n=1 Tax=Xyrauchen texanus TaxID=154827 RepID=UPI002241C1BB|nr:glutathione hydrolase 1 proenzyme-like [Xyrauchen texanus]